MHKGQTALVGIFIAAAGVAFVGTRLVHHEKQQPRVLAAAPTLGVATIAHPLVPSAKQTTLAAAPATLGGPVVLPDSPITPPSTVGAVWAANDGSADTTVAVTFPKQGLVFEYIRPAPSDGSAAHFQAVAQGIVSPTGAQIAQEITLNGGVPALAIQQNSDETGTNFGTVMFNVGGSEVRVMGHSPEAMLQGLAESILARSPS
jgi:hypothetical protein